MTAKHCVRTATLLAVLLVCAQSVTAALWEDPAAIPSFRGSSPFPTSGVLDGYVDYAVYAPGNYNSSITDYVYAYQVFNDSTVAINYFSVGLSPDVQVLDAWCNPTMGSAEPGGSIPWMSLPLSENVLYVFQAGNIKAGQCSVALLFTSDSPPEMGIGIVPGGVAGSVNVDVPSPVPEPATLVLAIGGAIMAFRRKQKVLKSQNKQIVFYA